MATESAGAADFQDTWSNWLLRRRHGGDAAYGERVTEAVRRYRDRVLNGARLGPGMTMLDVGTGEGLIPFGAIDRVGPTLSVILTDVSEPMLRHTEELARAKGVQEQCRFVVAAADRLQGVGDCSVDVVTSRSVLAYVADKAAAFREFYRVLKPGGRVSLMEPVFQDDAFEVCSLGKLIESQPNRPDIEVLRLMHRYMATQFPSVVAEVMKNPLTSYNERDLFRAAREMGFADIQVDLLIESRRPIEISWEAHLDVATHPWAPTLREILTKRFTPEEAKQFEAVVRPGVEERSSQQKELTVYLVAQKPT